MTVDVLPTAPRPEEPAPAGRLRFIDALRGVASCGVMAFHLTIRGALAGTLTKALPAAAVVLLAHGGEGVDVFFVLSGFVMAWSQRDARIDVRYLANFALRRSLRLDPPYWLTIALVLLLAAFGIVVDGGPAQVPAAKIIAANLFYLQDLLRLDSVVGVSWTLCYEVQFYLVLTVLSGVGQSLARRLGCSRGSTYLALFLPLGLLSLACVRGWLPARLRAGEYPGGLFLDEWHMFLLGALACWALTGTIRSRWFWLFAALFPVAFVKSWAVSSPIALATGIAIYGVGRAGRLGELLRWRPLQFLGRISYSLYLIHTIVGGLVLTAAARSAPSTTAAFAWVAAAALASIAAAYFMYRAVEQPGIAFGKKLKGRGGGSGSAGRASIELAVECVAS